MRLSRSGELSAADPRRSGCGGVLLLGHFLHVEIAVADPRMGAAGGGAAQSHNDLVRKRRIGNGEFESEIVRAEPLVVLCIIGIWIEQPAGPRLLVKDR